MGKPSILSPFKKVETVRGFIRKKKGRIKENQKRCHQMEQNSFNRPFKRTGERVLGIIGLVFNILGVIDESMAVWRCWRCTVPKVLLETGGRPRCNA